MASKFQFLKERKWMSKTLNQRSSRQIQRSPSSSLSFLCALLTLGSRLSNRNRFRAKAGKGEPWVINLHRESEGRPRSVRNSFISFLRRQTVTSESRLLTTTADLNRNRFHCLTHFSIAVRHWNPVPCQLTLVHRGKYHRQRDSGCGHIFSSS